MTRRRLYALPAAALSLVTGLAAPASAQSQSREPPCGACIRITIAAGQSLLLPEDLADLTVLVRGSGVPDRAVAEALGAIRSKGGRAGIVLIREDADLASIERLVFELKQALTEYRASAAPPAVMAVAVHDSIRQPLIERGIAAYADLILPTAMAATVPGALERTRQSREVLLEAPVDAVEARALLAEAARAASALPEGLTPVPGAALRCGGVLNEVFLHPQTQEHVALLPHCRDFDVGSLPGHRIRERIDLTGATIIRMSPPAAERFAEDVQVTAGRRYSVEEVVARHQTAVRRQRALVTQVISTGTLTLTFEAPGFPAPVTISSQTTIYADGEQKDLQQDDIRINGIEFAGDRIPRLPILEPERVAAAPLVISLTDQYRYRLEADDTVDGIRCFVVAFEPLGSGTLFAGRAWISSGSFALVKVAAVQTGLRGAIVSSEQVDVFREEREGIWLLARSDVRQVYEGAAHRTPIHRRLTLHHHLLDPVDFAERREAAYASDSVMLRDTPEGYRYLRRGTPGSGKSAQAVVAIAEAARRIRTLAGGVIVDPNISRPLPFAGFSYVDFDLFGTGAQLNAFFGGTYAQAAFSIPSVFKTRWQLAGRAFGIATSYNDRAFENGREIYAAAVRQRPAHASVWLLRPLTTRISVRVGYDLDYTRLQAAPETAPGFVVPPDQVVHAARLAIEGQRNGWTASLWWNPARRSGWRAWGRGADYEPRHADFQRYGVSAAKATALSSRVVTRVEAQWMDGHDLDRFSRYSFGTFDNRLRGYPSALVRYDRGGAVRAALAWSAARFLRLDLFADSAGVRDAGYGRGLRGYTGVGAAVEAPAPFGLLTAVEWGYGFRGVNADGSLGTHVIRVSAYKVF